MQLIRVMQILAAGNFMGFKIDFIILLILSFCGFNLRRELAE
jgi:hypothetical protein